VHHIPAVPPHSLRAGLSDYFLLSLLLGLLIGVGYVLIPLAGPLISAVVIGISFYPLHLRLHRRLRQRSPGLAALLTNILVLCFLIIPTALLIWVMSNEAQSITPTLKGWQTTYSKLKQGNVSDAAGPLRSARVWLADKFGVQPDQFRSEVAALANGAVQHVATAGAGIAKNSFRILFDLLVMMFTLFFIFRDGERMAHGFLSYLPLQQHLKADLSEKLHGTVIGVIRGWFLTSIIQGITAAVGYFIVGAPAVALFGVLTAITGLIPSVGTALVWLPIAVVYLMKGIMWKGVFLIVWGILIVGFLDNFLRPYLMKNKAEMPFLALFLAILGGIEVWGMLGIVAGPLLLAITPLFAEAYRHRFLTTKFPDSEKQAA
jgi:predicted PurR-regulated permease PerM